MLAPLAAHRQTVRQAEPRHSPAYTVPAVIITWDPKKAAANFRKHGVAFDEAATVFSDKLSTTFPSEDHSENEARFLTIGLSANRQILVVAHTEDDNIIRIISARQATSQEKRFKPGTGST
jgi:uncharacterized DUF497 family protein